MSERPVSQVPRWVIALLALGLAAQVGFKAGSRPPQTKAEDLPPPPPLVALRLASLGDSVALGKLLMLYLQAFDYRSDNRVPYKDLDYGRLEGWLGRILELDPEGQYPLLAASRLYAEVPVDAKQRQMLEFVYRQFFADPNRRWPWLAQAALIAKHRLHDLTLARRYAAAIQRYATASDVPPWARQMEIFILEDMNELDAARIMIGGIIQSGKVRDRAELQFLDKRLKELEKRTRERNVSK
jgi:hypothetical protein